MFPSIRIFSKEPVHPLRGQSIGVSARVSVLPMNAAAAAKLLQLCLALCEPIDGSPPGSPVPGILQARTLEWAVISFSNAWKWKVKVKSLSRVQLLATGLISFRIDWFDIFAVQVTLSRVFSKTTIQKHQSLELSLLYSPALTSIHDYWKNHSFD